MVSSSRAVFKNRADEDSLAVQVTPILNADDSIVKSTQESEAVLDNEDEVRAAALALLGMAYEIAPFADVEVKRDVEPVKSSRAIHSYSGSEQAKYAAAYVSVPIDLPSKDPQYSSFLNDQFSGDIATLSELDSLDWSKFPFGAQKFLLFGGVLESLHTALFNRVRITANTLVMRPVDESISPLLSKAIIYVWVYLCIAPLRVWEAAGSVGHPPCGPARETISGERLFRLSKTQFGIFLGKLDKLKKEREFKNIGDIPLFEFCFGGSTATSPGSDNRLFVKTPVGDRTFCSPKQIVRMSQARPTIMSLAEIQAMKPSATSEIIDGRRVTKFCFHGNLSLDELLAEAGCSDAKIDSETVKRRLFQILHKRVINEQMAAAGGSFSSSGIVRESNKRPRSPSEPDVPQTIMNGSVPATVDAIGCRALRESQMQSSPVPYQKPSPADMDRL